MTALTFDTLAYAKRLREAGVPEPQAEAQAAALADALKGSAVELATQSDLREMELRMDARFALIGNQPDGISSGLLSSGPSGALWNIGTTA